MMTVIITNNVCALMVKQAESYIIAADRRLHDSAGSRTSLLTVLV